MSPIQQLGDLIDSWGGELLKVDPRMYSAYCSRQFKTRNCFFPAPFAHSLGISWTQKKVVYVGSSTKIGDLIHETAHTFACRRTPPRSKEFDFFGWEGLLAKKLDVDLEWRHSHRDYVVGAYVDFGSLTATKQDQIVDQRIRFAKNLGLIQNGEPVSIRL